MVSVKYTIQTHRKHTDNFHKIKTQQKQKHYTIVININTQNIIKSSCHILYTYIRFTSGYTRRADVYAYK